MYQSKDLRVLKIIQKAREFSDTDLLNESLVSQLLNASLKEISNKNQIIEILNSLAAAKEKAKLSNK